jgi:hypothetical protein
MNKNYHFIGTDLVGYHYFGETSETDLTGNTLLKSIETMIDFAERERDYYVLFSYCVRNFGERYIEFVRKSLEDIQSTKRDIEMGEQYLKEENTGTHGKKCSEMLPELNEILVKQTGLANSLPLEIVKLVEFWND